MSRFSNLERLPNVAEEYPFQLRREHVQKAGRLAKKMGHDAYSYSSDLYQFGRHIHNLAKNRNSDQELTKEAQVSSTQQKTQWSCSAACLKAILAHWGTSLPELTLIKAIGAKKNRGAETTQIVEAAKKLGFDALEMSFDSLEQARALTDQDVPILADIQSFKHPGKGHYVVITKIDDQEVQLMDPNVEGNHRVISLEEMEERWWDRWMHPPNEVMQRWGIVVAPLGLLP